jgi:putative CocE/NonD family hydrolase
MRRGLVVGAAAGLLVAILPMAAARSATAPPSSSSAPTKAAKAPALVRQSGYVEMPGGIHLRYTLVRRPGAARLPTLFEYSGYDPGTNPDADYIQQFVVQDGGYNYIGVNVPGTGCSDGTYDFFSPTEAQDGARVIAWIIHQPWSNGKVGMIGKSFPGITQLFVAEQDPPGLVAIAPGHVFGDAYRDIAKPGGLTNIGFSSLWSFIGRPSYEFESSPGQVAAGDPRCVNGSTAEIRGLPTNPFVQLEQNPWDDALYAQRSPDTELDRIHVPMLATFAWQDEEVGSRGTDLLSQLDDLNRERAAKGQPQEQWWATLTNGDHGMARTPTELADLQRFYDHFLKGEQNGWDQRPRVQVWWDSGRNGTRAPGWVTSLSHWAEDQREAAGQLQPWTLQLAGGGQLDSAGAKATGSDTFAYVPAAGTQGIANPAYAYSSLPDDYLWSYSPPRGAALAYTSAPFSGDRTFLGSASADLWVSASAPDTDLQVTLTEVRPDGQEVFLQQGWLEVSQRALDPARSTALRPYQLHTAASNQPLTPGQAVLARVEIFPFGALIRKGSRLRLWIEAPTNIPQLWSFVPSPYAGTDTVYHDAAHPSRLVLPLVPNDPNRVEAYPACGSLIRQPCRPDPLGG